MTKLPIFTPLISADPCGESTSILTSHNQSQQSRRDRSTQYSTNGIPGHLSLSSMMQRRGCMPNEAKRKCPSLKQSASLEDWDIDSEISIVRRALHDAVVQHSRKRRLRAETKGRMRPCPSHWREALTHAISDSLRGLTRRGILTWQWENVGLVSALRDYTEGRL